jgi:single-stranded-DNA-specific exonuclease
MLGKAWVVAAAPEGKGRPAKAEDIAIDILHSRGVTGHDEIRAFLSPSIREQMPDPFVLKNMEQAARLAAAAILAGRRIAVFGDYDVDGITSTAIMLKYLRSVGCDPLWHLPTREGEGYGLNSGAIEELAARGAEVLITVDCGISGAKEVARAKELGLDVIITDHHSPDSILPPADAVVNPKQGGDESGLDYLAGVGVAFMFLVALNRELRAKNPDAFETNLMDYMDLVALGTICDTMPLTGLNRAFAATGLKVLDQRKNLGLKTLMDIAGAKKASVHVAGFVIGPRLNAAGRLDSAAPALDLLLTDNAGTAGFLAQQLDALNKDRKNIESGIMLRAHELAEECRASGRKCLFVAGDNWHGGVMGIIAGRLKDKFCMPAMVATRQDGVVNGSGRSVPGIDLGKIIHDAHEAGILTEGGGHAAAAGFSLAQGREAEFCAFLENAVAAQLDGCTLKQEITVDAEIDAGGANMRLLAELAALAPFGQGNPEPMLVLRGGQLAYASTMGDGSHLRGNLRTSSGTNLAFVGFNLTATPVGAFLLDEGNFNRKITLCGRLKENEFNGRVSAQFVIEDAAA